MFGSYEESLEDVLERIKGGLENGPQSGPSSKITGSSSSEISGLIRDARENIKQMRMHLRSSADKQAQTRLSRYESLLRKYETENSNFKKREALQLVYKEESSSQQYSDYNEYKSRKDWEDRSQRNMLLEEQNEKIAETQKMALETEYIGVEILDNLNSQREVITRTRYDVQELSSNIEDARTIVRSLAHYASRNRRILYTVIFLVIGTIGFALIYRFINGVLPFFPP